MVAVWRSPGVLQIGLDSAGLILESVPDGLDKALPLLTQPTTAAELATLLPELDRAWIDWLLAQLRRTELLAPCPAPARRQLVVVGEGELAEAVTDGLLAAGLSARSRKTSTAAMPEPAEQAGLTVLAGATVEPDRSRTDELLRDAQPHLVVRAEPDRVVVGPLVLPGGSPCVRCSDLARCRLDPGWPVLLAQLCREPVRTPSALLPWVAATAAIQVRAWLAGGTAETVGGTLEVGLPDYRLQHRDWPAHPGCGCLMPIS